MAVELSLNNIRKCLQDLNNIHDISPNIIHVAGTNGKGSTVSFMRYILEESGYTVNVFTSPHLVSFNERIRLKGTLISNEYLNDIKNRLESLDSYKQLSIFESTMVIAFLAFFEKPADYCILETGLGGQFDATNVISHPILNVISTIDYDHMLYLGDTLEKIAYEKSCIIKKNAIVVTSNTGENIVNVIINKAKNLAKQVIVANKHYSIVNDVLYYNNLQISLKNLSLKGVHQKINSALAIVSLLAVNNNLSIDTIENALQKTQWFGRLQEIKSFYGIVFNATKIYLDGAHNPSGGDSLRSFINNTQDKKNFMIFAMLDNKNLDGYLKNFQNCNIEILPFYTSMWQDDFHSYHQHQDIYNSCSKLNIDCKLFTDNSELFNYLKGLDDDSLILVCGSLYFIGNIMKDNNIVPV